MHDAAALCSAQVECRFNTLSIKLKEAVK